MQGLGCRRVRDMKVEAFPEALGSTEASERPVYAPNRHA